MNARYADLQWELSPWVRAVCGPAPLPRLPRGYRISGLAKTGAGPWHLELYRPGAPDETSLALRLADQWVKDAGEVRTVLDSLSDLAWIHQREQVGSYVVTVGPGDFIEDIVDA